MKTNAFLRALSDNTNGSGRLVFLSELADLLEDYLNEQGIDLYNDAMSDEDGEFYGECVFAPLVDSVDDIISDRLDGDEDLLTTRNCLMLKEKIVTETLCGVQKLLIDVGTGVQLSATQEQEVRVRLENLLTHWNLKF